MKSGPFFCLLLLLLTLHSRPLHATSLMVSGTVSGSWNVDTVFVTGHLLVPDQATLEIAPGTRIEFQSYFRLDVQGRILALGGPGDTILFTIRDTSNYYSQTSGRGGWSGIRFVDTPQTNDTSFFRFCRFEYGKATEDSVNCYGGAVQMKNFGKADFRDCLFYCNYSRYSGGAVYLRNAGAIVSRCRFLRNYSGNTGTIYGYGGGLCALYSSPLVDQNEFRDNASTGVGGAVSFDASDPLFCDNSMTGNFSALGGALGVLRSTPSRTLANNLVVNNGALFFGGGVCCIRSFPVLSNFTISNNQSAYGGGLYCNDSAMPSLYNTIIYGNQGFGTSVYIWDVFSAPNFYYCTIEGDTAGFEGSGGHEGYHGEYLDNISQEPSFYGQGDFPYQLNAGSPCIDAGTPDPLFLGLPGTDLAGAPRIWNDRVDMGAYEYNGTTGFTVQKEAQPEVLVFPNPVKGVVKIVFREMLKGECRVRVLDAKGRVCEEFQISAGVGECSHDFEGLTSGVYLLEITGFRTVCLVIR